MKEMRETNLPLCCLLAVVLRAACACAGLGVTASDKEVLRFTRKAVGGLTAGNDVERMAAEARLIAMQRAYLAAVLEGAKPDGEDAAARVARVLQRCAEEVAIARLLSSVSPEAGAAIRHVREVKPGLIEGALSDNATSRLTAMKEIAASTDAVSWAGPLVERALSDESEKVVLAALDLVCKRKWRSDPLGRKITQIIAVGEDHVWRSLWGDEISDKALILLKAGEALKACGWKGAAPVLARMLGDRGWGNVYHQMDALVVDLLGAIGDPHAIPVLVGLLRDDEVRFTQIASNMPGRGMRVEHARADIALAALIFLTKQDISDYPGLTQTRATRVPLYGFGTVDQRDRAIRKFRLWWKNNGRHYQPKPAGEGERGKTSAQAGNGP